MAVLKYFLILSVGLCWVQLASGSENGATNRIQPIPNQLTPDADYVAQEDVDFNEENFKKAAMERLTHYMSDATVQDTVTSARRTAELLLTDPISSTAIINLMHIIRDMMTNNQTLKTVRYIQGVIRGWLGNPEEVKDFFADFNGWFQDPQSLENVKRKDKLVEKCIHLMVVTKSLDNLTNRIRQLNFADLPEAIDTMFKNFNLLVKLGPEYKMQNFLSGTFKKVWPGSKKGSKSPANSVSEMEIQQSEKN